MLKDPMCRDKPYVIFSDEANEVIWLKVLKK